MKAILAAVASLIAIGCGPEAPPRIVIVAVDASGSAQEFMPEFMREVRNTVEELRSSDTFELYRFDRTADEIYVGPPLSAVEFKRRAEQLNLDRKIRGTSLVALMERLDGRLAVASSRPIEIKILTDCGVEGMTRADHARVRAIAEGWARRSNLTALTVRGPRPFHRNHIRDDLSPLGARLSLM